MMLAVIYHYFLADKLQVLNQLIHDMPSPLDSIKRSVRGIAEQEAAGAELGLLSKNLPCANTYTET